MLASLETWSDWSEAYYIKEDHGEEEETAGDAVNNQSRGGVGEDVVRHVGVTSSEIFLSLFNKIFSVWLSWKIVLVVQSQLE